MVEVTDEDRRFARDFAFKYGLGEYTTDGLVQTAAHHRIAAEQRGKLEGARLAIEAAAKDAEEWFPADTSKRYPSFGVIASIRALSPAKIVGEARCDQNPVK